MNKRQQLYKANRIAGMNMYNAALAAGYSINTATKACQKLEPKIKFEDHLEQAGLTDRTLTLRLAEMLQANKVIGYLHQYKKGEKGRERLGPDEAVSNEFLEVPDYATRIKAMELILKSKGHLKEKLEASLQLTKRMVFIIQDGRQQSTEQALPDRLCPEQSQIPGTH